MIILSCAVVVLKKYGFVFTGGSGTCSICLLFQFIYSLTISVSAILSVICRLRIIRLSTFRLILMKAILRASYFLFRVPANIITSLCDHQHSILVKVFLCNLNFLVRNTLP